MEKGKGNMNKEKGKRQKEEKVNGETGKWIQGKRDKREQEKGKGGKHSEKGKLKKEKREKRGKS